MTDHESTSPASTDPATLDFAVGADRIDAYITSVEQVLLAARVPATERVQILGDLETQITEMLGNEPLPISEATVAAVISRLEPPSHFAATYAGEPQSPQSPATVSPALRYSPWVIAAAGSCAVILFSCLLLLLCARDPIGPVLTMLIVLMLLTGTVVAPIALRKGLAQLRIAPDQYRGKELAIGTAIVYWTAVPLLLFLFACAITEGFILYPIGLAAFAYCHYLLIRRIYHRLTVPASEQPSTHSFRESLWRFTGLPQSAPC